MKKLNSIMALCLLFSFTAFSVASNTDDEKKKKKNTQLTQITQGSSVEGENLNVVAKPNTVDKRFESLTSRQVQGKHSFTE